MRNPTTAERIKQIASAGRASLANNAERNSKQKLNTGTLILALKYKDGVIVAADRMMTSGWDTISSMSERKLMPISAHSVVGDSGNIDVLQVVSNAYFHLFNLNTYDGEALAIGPQIELLHALLREFFVGYGEYWLWTGMIFAAVDPETKKRWVVEFSGAGRIDRELFAATGCGGDRAMAALEKHKRRLADELNESEALMIVFEGLFAGAQSTGVSHPKLAEPLIMLIQEDGVRELTSKEIKRTQKEAGR